MKVADLHKILSDALAQGHGDAPVFFDTEAKSFGVHLVAVDLASIETDPDVVSSISGDLAGFVVLTTREH